MLSASRIIWSPAAERDLLDIWAYYARVASPDVADSLLRRINGASANIAEHPLLSRDRSELLADLRSSTAPPHVIFFRVAEARVEIVRVLHGRRDFPAIFTEDN